MVVIDLDESLSVELTAGREKPCAYAVLHEGREVATYETSADPRTAGGRVGLRNVICRQVPGREKAAMEGALEEALEEHDEALVEEFGPR